MKKTIVPVYMTYNAGGKVDNDPWSRDSTDGHVTGAELSEHRDYDGFTVEGTGPFYAVVVGYLTGDTFGYDFRACVPFASSILEEANEYASRVNENGVEGSDDYCLWVGYFERLQSVEVFEVSNRFRRLWR